MTREELERQAGNLDWFHSIDLGGGLVTRGLKTAEQLAWEVATFRLPDFRGKTVLDVGAWDGYFSFAAERAGASRVVALDHYVWSIDQRGYWAEFHSAKPRPRFDETRHWAPRDLPGKRGFDLAHAALSSKVVPVVGDFMSMDVRSLGVFDVVLFLGVLYHLEDPFACLRRLAQVTGGLAVIETEGRVFPGSEGRCLFEFFPGAELDGDPSNWWAANDLGLESMCRAAGFRRVEFVMGAPSSPAAEYIRYRSVVHAWK